MSSFNTDVRDRRPTTAIPNRLCAPLFINSRWTLVYSYGSWQSFNWLKYLTQLFINRRWTFCFFLMAVGSVN